MRTIEEVMMKLHNGVEDGLRYKSDSNRAMDIIRAFRNEVIEECAKTVADVGEHCHCSQDEVAVENAIRELKEMP